MRQVILISFLFLNLSITAQTKNKQYQGSMWFRYNQTLQLPKNFLLKSELEEKNRELLQKNLELQKAKSQLEKQISQQIELGNINELQEIAQKLSQDFFYMHLSQGF